uniref:Uncharacterized protein n=1 Tax=Zea mays TaxID=4577 RepID=B4FWE6_MAIZE|nr:unknown [Zea mays]
MRKTRGATAEMMALARLRASATVDESRRRGGGIAARSPARRRPSCACSWTSTPRRDVRVTCGGRRCCFWARSGTYAHNYTRGRYLEDLDCVTLWLIN